MPVDHLPDQIYLRKPRTQRRVVITGMGAITPLGNDVNSSWKKAVEGHSGIDNIKSFDTSDFDCKIAGEIKGFNAGLYCEPKEINKTDRFIHLALGAASMALEDSGLEFTDTLKLRTGTIVGVWYWWTALYL